MSHYIHHVPGRLRVQCRNLKRNQAKASQISGLLGDFTGITKHQVNPMTGSIVINYDTLVTCPKRILSTLQEKYAVAPGATMQEPASAPGKLTKGVSSVTGTVGKAVVGFAVEKLVERSATVLIGALL